MLPAMWLTPGNAPVGQHARAAPGEAGTQPRAPHLHGLENQAEEFAKASCRTQQPGQEQIQQIPACQGRASGWIQASVVGRAARPSPGTTRCLPAALGAPITGERTAQRCWL